MSFHPAANSALAGAVEVVEPVGKAVGVSEVAAHFAPEAVES